MTVARRVESVNKRMGGRQSEHKMCPTSPFLETVPSPLSRGKHPGRMTPLPYQLLDANASPSTSSSRI